MSCHLAPPRKVRKSGISSVAEHVVQAEVVGGGGKVLRMFVVQEM